MLWYRVARLRTGSFSSTKGSRGAQNHFVWQAFDHELTLAEKFGEDFRVIEGPYTADDARRRDDVHPEKDQATNGNTDSAK